MFGNTTTTQAGGGLFGATQPTAAAPAFGGGTFGAATPFGASATPAVLLLFFSAIMGLFLVEQMCR